ncbi:hypothetical protein FKW31_12665 [Acetobacter sp. DmW_136]|uniref:hypothetical protein n=1 Tax=Acetobacter sp. DmW_136 TaxID=2591091 RepID=UPI00123B76E0|nr:hypothetical protein [Acetobacter sp. DmW_136]KAA8384398.1 hypothetical protein FKW31_12665 [Acetobacter sp. DmW_136]
MAKIVNTLPHSSARATLPLLERLRHVLERFMQPHAQVKKKEHKGLLALLHLLHQYSLGGVHMPLGAGEQKSVFSVPLPALGAGSSVFAPTTGRAERAGYVGQSADVPFVLRETQTVSQRVLQNAAPLPYRAVLVASTAQPRAVSGLEFTQPSKPCGRQLYQGVADILARRPFSVSPGYLSAYLPERSGPVAGGISKLAAGAVRVSASWREMPVIAEYSRHIQHFPQYLQRKNGLQSFVFRQGVSVPQQPARTVLQTTPRAAAPDAQGRVGAFLPSSPLMQAAVQPVLPWGQSAPAPQGQSVVRSTASPFAELPQQPPPLPPRAAMQGLGGGDSTALAALSTLGSI